MTIYQATKLVTTTRRAVKATGDRKFMVNGNFVPENAIVECGEFDAEDLIARKLAVDATPAEVEAAGANIIVAPSNGEKWKDAD